MLNAIATAIEDRLKELSIFKAVEQNFSKRALSMPPAAVFYLLSDKAAADKPAVARDLTWGITLLVSTLGADQGQLKVLECIDAVRNGFSEWKPFAAGVLPVSPPEIIFDGFEETLLIYSATLSMRVFPQNILY